MKDSKKVVAIDFGATKVKAGVVNSEGKILGQEILLATQSNRPAVQIVATMKSAIEKAIVSADLKLADIVGIAIGSPGPLDITNGILLDTPNLPTMKNYPLRKVIAQHFEKPVELNNDGNCFVLGEAFFGAAKDASIVCGVTLGTGFGCGIVFNKKIYIGATGTAAEVWCSPYAEANFEEYGSGRTLSRFFEQNGGKKLPAKDIYFLAVEKNSLAIKTFDQFGEHLGKILAIMVNLLDPDVLVIGGSISNAWEFFQESLQKNLFGNINNVPKKHLRIQRASLGDNAGLLGAAALLF